MATKKIQILDSLNKNAVLYTPQELTKEEKAQVRENLDIPSLDENGKIPLEQLPDDIGGLTEVSWEDIKNRPFGDGGSLSIEWDGNATGKEMVTFFEEESEGDIFGYYFVKVHDTPIEAYNEIIGGYTTLSVEGNALDLEINNESIGALSNNNFIIFSDGEPGIINVYSNDSPIDMSDYLDITCTFPSVGVYYLAVYMNRDYVSPMAYTSKLLKEDIKTLDIKYLPKNMALGYEEKAFEDIIWDGNTDGLDSTSMDVDTGDGYIVQFKAYKVSDAVLSKSQMVGGKITYITDSGDENEFDIDDLDGLIDVNSNGSFFGGDPSFFVITEDNTDADLSMVIPGLSTNFAEKGIWFLKPEVGGMVMYCTTGIISGSEVTKIDVKYLPTDIPYGLATLNYAGQIDKDYISKADGVYQSDYRPITSNAVWHALQNVNVDLSNYYTKNETYSKNQTYSRSEIDNAHSAMNSNISNCYTKAQTYSKSEIDTALQNVSVDLSGYYTKTETYSKREIDSELKTINTGLSERYTKSEVYNKSEIDSLLGDVSTVLNEINALIGE